MWMEFDEHQRKALDKMHNGCVLCGDTGTGKSRVALMYYYHVLSNGILDFNEYHRMTPNLDLYIITTALKRDSLDWEKEMAPFLLSTHDDICAYAVKVFVDSWNNIKKYTLVKDAFFIFDEQRTIGSGVWSNSFITIAKHNQWILLSATPGDKWIDYCPVFIANGFYKNRTEFKRMHVVETRYGSFPKIERYLGLKRLRQLRNDILVEMPVTRKTKKTKIDILCSYDHNIYKEISQYWNPWTETPIRNISELCFLLRKCASSDSSRLDACKTIIDERKKVIVFYNYDYELAALKQLLVQQDYDIAERNGHKHEVVPKSDSWVYLVQYDSGAEGWNCTTTDTIIFYSENYSYRKMKQAEGRIDRWNTKYTNLYFYSLYSTAPIEMAVRRCLREKKIFNESRFAKEWRKNDRQEANRN